MLMNVACAYADLFAQQGQRIYIIRETKAAALAVAALAVAAVAAVAAVLQQKQQDKDKATQQPQPATTIVEVNGIKPPRP